MARPKWLAPAGTFAGVLGAVTVVAIVASGSGSGPGSGSDGPRRLPISAAGARDGSARLAAGGAEDAPAGASYGGGRYKIVGDLGELPTEGPAFRLAAGKADAGDVGRLAKALGLTADPVRVTDGWEVRGTTRTLFVSDGAGNPWHYDERAHRCEPATDGAPDGGDCAVSSSSGVATVAPAKCPPPPPPGAEPAVDPACEAPAPPPQPPAPNEQDTLEVTRKVLAEAGYDVAAGRLTTEEGWGDRTGVFDPVVGGLQTMWWSARVSVDVAKQVVRAYGWLAPATMEDTYPLLTPQQAIDRGHSGPEPAIARCMAMTPECTEEPKDREVTKARLGLIWMPSYRGAEHPSYLVPAWLLTVKGGTGEEALLALPDEYVEQPPVQQDPGKDDPATDEPGGVRTDPGPTGGGGEPGSTGTDGGSDGTDGAKPNQGEVAPAPATEASPR